MVHEPKGQAEWQVRDDLQSEESDKYPCRMLNVADQLAITLCIR